MLSIRPAAAPPSARRPLRGATRRGLPGIALVAVCGVLLPAAAARAQVGAARVPSLAPPTREELFRKFDLDGDGKVDPAEAEIARSKMRRERLEQMRRSRVDPITGRKRGEIEDETKAEEGERGDDAAGEAATADRPIMGIDDLLGRSADDSAERGDQKAKERSESGRKGSAFRSGPRSSERPRSAARMTDDPAADRPRIANGGVRAGAPPARPGYGAASPKEERKPLNAGRPAAPRVTDPLGAAGRGGQAAGEPARTTGRRAPAGGAPPSAPRVPLFPDRSKD